MTSGRKKMSWKTRYLETVDDKNLKCGCYKTIESKHEF